MFIYFNFAEDLMSRYSSVQQLFVEVNSSIGQIESLYEEAKTDETKNFDYNVKVKNTLENLRSALDFIASDISEHTKISGKGGRVYFPYGNNDADFRSSIGRSFPGLQSSNIDIYNALESFQTHKTGDSIVVDMCMLTNSNKHNDLSKYVRVNSPESNIDIGNFVSLGNGGSVTFTNSMYGGKMIGVGGHAEINGQMTAAEARKRFNIDIDIVKEFLWVRFDIGGKNVDVLDFLKRSYAVSLNIVNAIYSIIPKV
ncbi:hypothetical protein NMF47_00355|uniref:hypothetical protein n=1 Tax=Serratia nevei TaxID=2703794 RepID=UPI0027E4CE1C|nr:hypothetical protein [Serratia nevei]MDQ7766945.1 hypothetical protein [Serratia nevei]